MINKYMKDYIEVHERIQDFYEKYPDGSLQGSWEWHCDGSLIIYTAKAFRNQQDERPGIGTAQEPFPGKTPYTKGSEIQNAETSAWGRAMAALGVATKNSIATAHEVRLAQERQNKADDPVDEKHQQLLKIQDLVSSLKDSGKNPKEIVSDFLKAYGEKKLRDLDVIDLDLLIDELSRIN